MLQPGWYLPDTDWFAHLRDAPKDASDRQALVDQLDRIFRTEPCFGPASTVTATRAILLGVEHLGDTMAHAARSHDLPEVARLLSGLTLIDAHLTQTIQRIAGHADARAFPGLAGAPGHAVTALAEHLGAAGAAGEILAGHLKTAHLILRDLIT